MLRRLLVALGAATLVAAGLAATPAAATEGDDGVRPMIFVHGFLGSGQQFEAQALRFTSNGWPADHIEMFEHDSLLYPGSQAEVWGRLDGMIADLLDATGADQVYLLGHSQGTGVVQGYLNSDPARAANVAKYVNLDGGAGGTVPDTVETLAIWGEGDPGRQIPGATNVQFPDQAHTEVVNSPETFVEIYRFFTGDEPAHREVVRELPKRIEVSGRVQLFPQNTGVGDATLSIYKIHPRTGLRLTGRPEATFELTDGRWGPFAADGDAYYEFAVSRDTGTHHIYMQRFVRSSRWVRILTSEPGGLADSFWEVGDDRSNMVILRNKEWWGDQGAAGDSLEINGVEILNAATSPRQNRTIGIFVHDDGADGKTDVSAPVSPSGLPFLIGIDMHIPAADPPDATISVVADPRRGDGPESLCVPNWASSTDRISVQMNSYHHLLDHKGRPTDGHANPKCAEPGKQPPGGKPPADRPPVDTPPDKPGAPIPPAPPATPVVATPNFTG